MVVNGESRREGTAAAGPAIVAASPGGPTPSPAPGPAQGPGDGRAAGRRPFEPAPLEIGRAGPGREFGGVSGLLRAEWTGAVFIHYEVDAGILQEEVPFELDLWEGRAFVSLVAFTMGRLRPCRGGWLAELVFRPIARTRFLNVRTYVRGGATRGIYFIAEFLSNRLSVPLGPPTFGLPYRRGDLDYRNDDLKDGASGRIRAPGGRRELAYHAVRRDECGPREALPGTLDWFLIERYDAFTCHRGRRRMFHVAHRRWPLEPVDVSVRDEGLLETTGAWWPGARLIGGHHSAGVRDVRLGPPMKIEKAVRRTRVFFEV